MFKAFLIALILGLVIGCSSNNEKQVVKIDERILLPNNLLLPLFDSIRTKTQIYKIQGTKDTLIVGENGTVISINKNTFIDSSGNPPTASIEIRLVEIITLEDVIKTNLHTVSDGKVLQTAGMLFLDAVSNNKPLRVAEGKDIFIVAKSQINDSRMLIFNGDYNNLGFINWSLDKGMENHLIPIPLKLLNFRKGAWECSLSDTQIGLLNNEKYENTYLATREFENRASVLNFLTCDYFGSLSQDLLEIYLNNIDKDLFYSDSLVVDFLWNNQRNNIDTLKEFDFNKKGWMTWAFQALEQFKNQRLTNVINFDKLEMNENTTIEQLLQKGISLKDAERIVALYLFSTNKLGWINIDAFLLDKNLKESNFTIDLNSKDTLEFISLALIIPSYRVSISPTENNGNTYSFTKNADGNRKLPVGTDAIIVAFSYKNNHPFYGKKKIKIPEKGVINLDLKISSQQLIKRDIEKILK
jgi:hypothetical protein